jgi:hypothetical protein
VIISNTIITYHPAAPPPPAIINLYNIFFRPAIFEAMFLLLWEENLLLGKNRGAFALDLLLLWLWWLAVANSQPLPCALLVSRSCKYLAAQMFARRATN